MSISWTYALIFSTITFGLVHKGIYLNISIFNAYTRERVANPIFVFDGVIEYIYMALLH